MTERIQIITVALERDMRTDDVEPLMKAIGCIRGVANVFAGEPISPTDWVERERIRLAVAGRIQELLMTGGRR